MKISYINLTSLICCFIPVILKTHSIKAFIILFNGFLFHTHIDNKPLFINDLIINSGMIADTYYYNPHLRKRITIACVLTLINFYITYGNNRKYYLGRKCSEIVHSLLTHVYGSYLLYLSY